MEGYTNIIGSSYDFDDLDIEGRVVDEWKANPEERSSSNLNVQKQVDEKTILSERVKLDNGQFADVYSSVKKNDTTWYTCHLCADTMVGLSALWLHKDSSKHRTNMSKPSHPRSKFVKLNPKENLDLEPGEPVPPGLEEEIFKSCQIQPKLDACQHLPLIGLEFMVEITESTLEDGYYYQCLLCEKNGSERNMIIHFTSIFHYMKYLSIFFPTVARKLHGLPNKKLKKSFGLLVTEIVQDIENKFGRMKPHSEPNSNFFAPGRKNELYTSIFEGQHFRETENENFCEKATAENVDRKSQELLNAPPQTGKPADDNEGTRSLTALSIFNKNNRVNVDKKQLRQRNEDSRNRSKSPDVQFVSEEKRSSEKRKRSRSRSLSSISSLSSTSSGPHRYRSRSRTQSRRPSPGRSRRNWSRSRSRSPAYRYHRQRSPSYTRGGRHSPGRRYYPHNNSRGRSPDYKHGGTDKYGRSFDRDKYDRRNDRYPRERYHDREPSKDVPSAEQRLRWSKFREEFSKVEEIKREKLKFYEKNPEKHPQYPEEWKTFWNRRYNELQRSGIDPAKHDFKPEWISFWTKRMKEMFEEDLLKEKNDLQSKYLLDDSGSSHPRHNERKRLLSSPGLTDISPPTPERKDAIADIKQTWKALTGSDIKEGPKRPLSPWEEESKTQDLHGKKEVRSPSPPSLTDKMLEDMPQRKTRTSSLIFVLRKLTVLEQQLGSLAPKVFEMMSQALALEKVKEDASLDLLFERENSVYLETVREKLIALLCAGVVPRNFVNTARSAIKHIDISLYLTSKRERIVPIDTVRSVMGLNPCNTQYPSNPYMQIPQPVLESPVIVPGVGQVDKVAIAQQIAAVLIEQGRTDVGEAELQYLINAVVGMAEASKNSSQPMTTANFLLQIQTQPAKINETKPQDQVSTLETASSESALKLLQSAYNDSSKVEQDSPKPEAAEKPDSKPSIEQELVVALTTVNKLDEEEQQVNFIKTIQSTNPEIFKRMCPFLPIHLRDVSNCPKQSNLSNSPKRSPICIPISKEKSEQKVKPNQTGRLSPFSSRSAGLNPTESESTTTPTVVLDDDEYNSNKKMESENKGKSPKWKPDNDEDDDDYSYEDIYKAAQEKLQGQIGLNINNALTKKQEAGVKLPSTEDLDDDVTFVTEEKPHSLPLLDKGNFSEKDPFNQTMNIPTNLSSLNTDSHLPQSYQPGNISKISTYPQHPMRQVETAHFKQINTTHQEHSKSKLHSNKMANEYTGPMSYTQPNPTFYANREPNFTGGIERLRPPQTGDAFINTLKQDNFMTLPHLQTNRDAFGKSLNTNTHNITANREASNQYGGAPYSTSDRGSNYSSYNQNPYQNQNAYQMNQHQTGQPQFGNDNFRQTHPTNPPSIRFANPSQSNLRYPSSHYPQY